MTNNRYSIKPLTTSNYIDMTKKILAFILLFSIFSPKAQTINMDFPKFAGKTYDFVIFQGDKEIKIIQDTIPHNGKFELRIPSEYAPYTGMSRWLITNSEEGGGLDLAIPGLGYAVSCAAEQPTKDNLLFKGYNPVNQILEISDKQQKIVNKFKIMSMAMKLYGDNDKLYPVFEKELKAQQLVFQEFKKELEKSKDYFSYFIPIFNITNGVPVSLTDDPERINKEESEYITNGVDIDYLYTSGFWRSILETWVSLNMIDEKSELSFVENFKKLSNRITNPEKYADFLSVVTTSLSKFGKDKEIELIRPIVLRDNKIKDYSGKLSVYKNAFVGSLAPDLVITEHVGKVEDHNHQTRVLQSKDFAKGKYKKTAIIFYQSGCGPCENLMGQLPGNYKLLKDKGVRVISISADSNPDVFKNSSSSYPWTDKYCDYEGIKGVNFTNYAVSGTPTIYLINKKGNIESRMFALEELLDKIK
ncbi:thioredoxin-like protein [Chryseobacterium sp. AG363]|nr:thioredoxin-like protein [Chryseobacterium sp. AG363]